MRSWTGEIHDSVMSWERRTAVVVGCFAMVAFAGRCNAGTYRDDAFGISVEMPRHCEALQVAYRDWAAGVAAKGAGRHQVQPPRQCAVIGRLRQRGVDGGGEHAAPSPRARASHALR